MSVALGIVGWVVFGLAVLAGLALDLVGLFGNWIILGAVACAWVFSGFDRFDAWTIVILALLAGAGEVIEALAAGFGAKKFGAGPGTALAAVAGCVLGAIVGTPWFPILGTLAGACLGAFVFAACYEYLEHERTPNQAVWTGIGAALGKVAGIFAKAFVGFVMLAVAALMV